MQILLLLLVCIDWDLQTTGVFTYVRVFPVLNRFVELFRLLMGWSFEYFIVTIVTFFSVLNLGSLSVLKTSREGKPSQSKAAIPSPAFNWVQW